MLFFGMLVSTGALLYLIQSKGASLFGGKQEEQSVEAKQNTPLEGPSVSRIEYQAKLDKAQTHLKELETAFRKDREETIREHTQEAESQEAQNTVEVSSLLSPESREKLILAKQELKLINKTLLHLKKAGHTNAKSSSADIPVSNISPESRPATLSTELPEQSFILGDTAYTAPAPKDYQKIRVNSDSNDDIQPATLDNEAGGTSSANNP